MTQLAASSARLAGFRWRRHALRIAFAGTEVSWFTPFFAIFVVAARTWPPLALGALLLLVELGFYFWSEFAESRQLSAGVERLAALLALPVLILLGWRVFLFPGLPAGDMRWIPAAFSGLVTSDGAGFWAIMASVLFLWWRGLALSRREFEFESVAFSFRVGLLLLVVGTLLLSATANRQVLAFIFPFFFFSLIAVSLARLEEVGRIRGEVGRLFDLTWLAILVGTIVLVLAVGLLVVLAARPESIDAMRALWAPVGNWLLDAFAWLVTIVLWPFEPLMRWLSGLFAEGFRIMQQSGALDAILAVGPIDVEQNDPETVSRVFEMILTAVRMLCGAAVLAALLAGGLWALRRERKRLREEAEVHEELEAGLGDALAGLLRGVRNRLRGAANLVGQFGVGSDLLTALSVRNIYANTARLAKKRGYPRHKARTAYEYLPDLQAAFPAARDEARLITDAYVGVAYGDLPTSKEELADLRAAYERLKDSPPASA
ncbi:MAG: DUF4129 domain-containing protein [Caldilineales bacterium]